MKLEELLEELLEVPQFSKALLARGIKIDWDVVKDCDAYLAANEKAAIIKKEVISSTNPSS